MVESQQQEKSFKEINSIYIQFMFVEILKAGPTHDTEVCKSDSFRINKLIYYYKLPLCWIILNTSQAHQQAVPDFLNSRK